MYFRNNKQNILQLKADLSVQSLSVQRRDKRLEIRLPGSLKSLVENIAETKNKSVSELTILLWLDYLSKTGNISGRVINKNEEELKSDVEDFLKRT